MAQVGRACFLVQDLVHALKLPLHIHSGPGAQGMAIDFPHQGFCQEGRIDEKPVARPDIEAVAHQQLGVPGENILHRTSYQDCA